MTTKLRKLFEPIRIGSLEVKNRMVMAPMVTNSATAEGYVTEQTLDYYEERARGGVGLVITEANYVDPLGKHRPHTLGVDDDRCIPGLSKLAQVIKKGGAKAALQLHHGGRETRSSVTGSQPLAPSPLPGMTGEVPKELTLTEIEHIIESFAKAAERAKKAGFDAVEVHAAHIYLLRQFLSSACNKRRDAYGGELENRARILIQVIKAIKERVGEDYPVWCRINGAEYGIEDGINLEEAQEVARRAEEAGACAVHVSAAGFDSEVLPLFFPFKEGALAPLAEGIKAGVTIPVMTVGRITPEVGERILQEGKADLIAIGRALIADPELPNKAASGRLEEIRHCIACNFCVDKVTQKRESTRCAINAAAGREKDYRLKPAEKVRKVVVVGGGPAGMEAARVAALRGHQVTLFEREPRLGGQLLQAALPPEKERIQPFTDYLINQVHKLGVTVKLGEEADSRTVEDMKPDVVILATGVTTFTPDIPGIGSAKVVTAAEVLEGKAEVGEGVLVIGGELVGCETADFLLEKGKKVTVTTMEPSLASKEGVLMRERLLARLTQKGASLLAGVSYEEITERGAVIIQQGERVNIEADSIVLAAGSRPNTELFKEIEGKVPEVHLAGDCVEPRRIHDAVEEGARIALEI